MPARYLLNREEDLKDYEPPDGVKGSCINPSSTYSTSCGGNTHQVKKLVKKIKSALKRRRNTATLPNFFVGLGASGAVLASVLSYEFNRPFIYIRKADISRFAITVGELDDARYNNKKVSLKNILHKIGHPNDSGNLNWDVEQPYSGKTFWFVDDCISSGLTFRQTIHMATIDEDMRLTGVALTSGSIEKNKCRRWALLSEAAPLTIITSY